MSLQIFLVLIKLNFYFLIGFIIQYVLIYVHVYGLEYTLTMLLIPTAFFSMLIGTYFVQQEIKFGVIGIIVSLSSLTLDSTSVKYNH